MTHAPDNPDARARLAERQAGLVRALCGGGAAPEGFDAGRVAATAEELLTKRLGAVRRAWPVLARELGARYAELFREYASATPHPAEGGPLADGRVFAATLRRRGELPDAARVEVLGVDVRFRLTPAGLVPRRGWTVRAAVLHNPRRLVVAAFLPPLGEWRWSLSLELIVKPRR